MPLKRLTDEAITHEMSVAKFLKEKIRQRMLASPSWRPTHEIFDEVIEQEIDHYTERMVDLVEYLINEDDEQLIQ